MYNLNYDNNDRFAAKYEFFWRQKCAKSDIQLEKQSKHDNNHYNMLADVKKT